MKVLKHIILILANMIASYLLVKGILNPDTIGWVKDRSGMDIQPDSAIIQIAGWLLMFCFYILILLKIKY